MSAPDEDEEDLGMISLYSLVVLVWTALVFGTSLFAATRALRSLKPDGVPPEAKPLDTSRVVLLRPCAGSEPSLRATLASTGDIAGLEGAQLIFAVASRTDPAFAIAIDTAEQLRARGLDAQVIETSARHLPNRKAEQLALSLAKVAAARDLVVVADSDVDLAGQSLGKMLGPLQRAGEVSAVWVPVVERCEASRGDRASVAVLSASLHAFPILAQLGDETVVGKLFAIRRRSLEAIGGFQELAEFLGEDAELARRLRARGERVVALPMVATSLASGRSLSDVIMRFSRWLTVLRAQRPWLLASYPLLFAATPLLLVAHLGAWGPWSFLGASLATLGRVAVGAAGYAVGGSKLTFARAGWLLVGDVVLLLSWLRALVTTRIAWRGRPLTIAPGGRLVEAP